jgi:hypothetical protein
LVTLGRKVVADVTRAKNPLKSNDRQHGVAVSGSCVFSPDRSAEWLREIKSAAVRSMLGVLYDSENAAQARGKQIGLLLRRHLHQSPAYKRLLSVPEFGPVACPILLAVVDDPWRFPHKRRLWSYAGLGVRRRSSGTAKRTQEGRVPRWEGPAEIRGPAGRAHGHERPSIRSQGSDTVNLLSAEAGGVSPDVGANPPRCLPAHSLVRDARPDSRPPYSWRPKDRGAAIFRVRGIVPSECDAVGPTVRRKEQYLKGGRKSNRRIYLRDK